MEAIHVVPAAAPAAPLALRQPCGRLELLAAALAPGRTLCRDERGYVLRDAAGAELERAPGLVDLVLLLSVRLDLVPLRPQATVRLTPALVRGIVSVRYFGEGIGAFLRCAAVHEIERRRALLDEEEVGRA